MVGTRSPTCMWFALAHGSLIVASTSIGNTQIFILLKHLNECNGALRGCTTKLSPSKSCASAHVVTTPPIRKLKGHQLLRHERAGGAATRDIRLARCTDWSFAEANWRLASYSRNCAACTNIAKLLHLNRNHFLYQTFQCVCRIR